MIIYGLLLIVITVLDLISKVLGALIPDFPEAVISILNTLSIMLNGGITFISFFFFWNVIGYMISLIIAFHGFKISKDAIMKVLGHFIGN